MTTYLGALSHAACIIAIHRDGRRVRWQTWMPGQAISTAGSPHQAHDAIEQWITSVTEDWTEQAELRRRALPIRYRIDQKEPS